MRCNNSANRLAPLWPRLGGVLFVTDLAAPFCIRVSGRSGGWAHAWNPTNAKGTTDGRALHSDEVISA